MIRLRRQTKPCLLENKSSWSKDAKKVWIGGDHPVAVQSMTTTDTADVDKTLEQVYGLAMAGCEIVRVTCQDARDAAGLPAIVARSPVPIVADVHFDHRMALAAIEAGVAKLRLNPGNITDPVKTREVVKLAIERGTPIRIGVNMGSLARDLEEKLGHTPEALAASALRHVEILEDLGHTDIIISVKAHDALDHDLLLPPAGQAARRARHPLRRSTWASPKPACRAKGRSSPRSAWASCCSRASATPCGSRWRPIRSRKSRSPGGSSRRSGCAKRASTSPPARRADGPRSRSSSWLGWSRLSPKSTPRRSRSR